MKKEYQKPECDFVRLSTMDIVRTSVTPTGAGFNGDDNRNNEGDFV